MNEPQEAAPQEPAQANERTDVMDFYRERIMYTLAIAILIFVTPFAVLNFIQGHYALATAFTVFVIAFFIDGLAIHLKRPPPIPFAYLVIPGIIVVMISLFTEGIPGGWGCFPAVLLCYFVLPRRIATITSAAMLIGGYIAIAQAEGQEMAIRFTVAMALNVVTVYFVTNVIQNLQTDLVDQASTDALTGALNRRQMEFALDEAMTRHQRASAAASLLMIDIDHFKKVNDELGHAAGDRVLKGLVQLIKSRTRKLDRLFRMGGEEFLLLLPDTPGVAAMKQAENLRARIESGQLLKDRVVTVSIGVSEYHGTAPQNVWIKAADDALYRAKSEGRNRVMMGECCEETETAQANSDDRRIRER